MTSHLIIMTQEVLYFERRSRQFDDCLSVSIVVRRTVGERVDAGVTVKTYHLRLFTDGSTALVKKNKTRCQWDTFSLTMVLKQCQSRLKLFNFNHPEKWYDPQDRASIFMPAATSIFVSASACSQCNLTPSFSKFEKTPLRWRRAPGVNITHLSAVTWMSVRGNKHQR